MKLFDKKMDSDLDSSDILVYISDELQTKYRDAKDAADKAQVLQDFLRRWDVDTALDDVKKQVFDFPKGKSSSFLLFLVY